MVALADSRAFLSLDIGNENHNVGVDLIVENKIGDACVQL
jgi:hypothetical protein